MKLYHATPARNQPSIRKRGLLTAKSKGKMPAVWLHTASRGDWATLHTMDRHSARKVAIVECSVPRSWVTLSKRGLWHCDRDIPPERIKREVSQ